MRSTRSLLVAIVVGVACAPPALAAPAWQPREEVADQSSGRMTRAIAGADQVDKLFGDPSSRFSDRDRIGLRANGAVGPFSALPGVMGDAGFMTAQDAAGNLLLADDFQIALRPAGRSSAVGPMQQLGGSDRVGALAVAPTGEALVGIGTNPARVAFRPAGATSQVDVASAQSLPGTGASDRIVGMALDASGAAVVVYTSGNALLQTTRAAGQTSFTNPVQIPSGLPKPTQYRVFMDSDPSGWAILTWAGISDQSTSTDTAVAAVRAPGRRSGRRRSSAAPRTSSRSSAPWTPRATPWRPGTAARRSTTADGGRPPPWAAR
jgi:hypothetical protein